MAKVLIAEDDPLLSSILSNKFQASGYEVLAAFDGDEAWDKTKEWGPDILLLDIMMPKKDGWQVLEEMQKRQPSSALPILILSNLGEAADRERAQKLGVTEYMVKANTTPKDIVEKVQGILKKS